MWKDYSKQADKSSEAPTHNLPAMKKRKKKRPETSPTGDSRTAEFAPQYERANSEEIGQHPPRKLSNIKAKRSKEEKTLQAIVRQGEPEARDTSSVSKKRKRKDVLNDSSQPANSYINEDDETTATQPQRKKRKNTTEFVDPREDESLGSQCRKALEYAFTQVNKPSRWKFNKARQNWIVRNIWSPDTLPDVHFPLVLKYLSKVQGGCREQLKETAESHLKPTEHSSTPDKPQGKVVKFETPFEATQSNLIPSPGPLIALPISPNSSVNSSKSIGIPNKHTLGQIRQERARQVLAVLCSNDNA